MTITPQTLIPARRTAYQIAAALALLVTGSVTSWAALPEREVLISVEVPVEVPVPVEIAAPTAQSDPAPAYVPMQILSTSEISDASILLTGTQLDLVPMGAQRMVVIDRQGAPYAWESPVVRGWAALAVVARSDVEARDLQVASDLAALYQGTDEARIAAVVPPGALDPTWRVVGFAGGIQLHETEEAARGALAAGAAGWRVP